MRDSENLGDGEPRSITSTTAKEDHVFQAMYKETTGAKSSKVRGHGYLSNPNKNQLLQERFEEQEREVQRLKEQLAKEAADKQAEMEEFKATIRQELMQEFQTLIAQNQKQALVQEVIRT